MPDLTERTQIELLALETGWRITKSEGVTEVASDRYVFTAWFSPEGEAIKVQLATVDGRVLLMREHAAECATEGCLSVGDWFKGQLERWQIAYALGDRLRGDAS
jgi:hypothetical protein